MRKRVIPLAAVSVAAAGTMALVTPSAAFADGADRYICYSTNGSAAACAYLDTHGEIVHVTDAKADGWGARAQIQVYSNGYWVNHSHDCFDDTSQGTPETTCNYSITDGTTIRLHLWGSHNGSTRGSTYSATTTA